MILIVDDRPENILPLQRILNLHNFQTDTASSGEMALKKILKNSYSLIILDVQMPGMDGFEVAEALSGFNKAKDTPIIFLSAVSTDKRFITQGYNSGGIDYLTKPVDPEILILKVRTFHRLSEQQQELKKNREEVAGHVQELHSVLESLPSIAFTIGGKGDFEYANRQWFKYAPDLKNLPEAHPDDVHVYSDWQAARETGLEFNAEVRIKNIISGLFIYHHLRITPVLQDEKIVRWVGTYTDINQQKVTTEQLEQQVNVRTAELINKNMELETYNHELQQFTWVVSHDLKEPLRKIQTFNQMVKDKYLIDDETARKFIDRTISASDRMSKLIDNLLHYSRLSVKHEYLPTDLNGIINELLDDFEDLIKNENAEIIVGKLPVIDAIPSQLRQVFQNLLSNALKFVRPDVPPVIKISNTFVSSLDFNAPDTVKGAFCKITFEDNGIGFDQKYIDRIFLIFQRLNNSASYEGTGIGLAIAKKIIEQHGGAITANASEIKGASFIIILPLTQKAHL